MNSNIQIPYIFLPPHFFLGRPAEAQAPSRPSRPLQEARPPGIRRAQVLLLRGGHVHLRDAPAPARLQEGPRLPHLGGRGRRGRAAHHRHGRQGRGRRCRGQGQEAEGRGKQVRGGGACKVCSPRCACAVAKTYGTLCLSDDFFYADCRASCLSRN